MWLLVPKRHNLFPTKVPDSHCFCFWVLENIDHVERMIKLCGTQSSFHMTSFKEDKIVDGCRMWEGLETYVPYKIFIFYNGKIPKLERACPWSHSGLCTVSSLRPGILIQRLF